MSVEARYSCSDIDRMRDALNDWCVADYSFPGGNVDVTLRNYLLAGIPSEEVIANAKAQGDLAWARRRDCGP